MDPVRLHADLKRLDEARTLDELTASFRSRASALGFDAFVYALRIPEGLSESRFVVVKGYPDAWLERYFERGFLESDPVIAYCRDHVRPIAWTDLDTRVEPTPSSRRVMDEATEFGLRNGVSVPVHGPRGELGVLSLANDRGARAGKEVAARALPHMPLLAGYLHEAVHRVVAIAGGPSTPLTMRERECLLWAAEGKTSWEIATVLSVSERTVNFHLANAMAKLGVATRQHAIAKAILLGVLRPSPM